MKRALPRAFVAAALAAGCSRPAGEGLAPSPVASSPAVAPSAVPAPPKPASLDAGAEAAPPLFGPFTRCYANFRPTSTAKRDVQRLALLCGPSVGMRRLGDPFEGDASATPIETSFVAKAGECFRVFAVAEPPVTDLAVSVSGPGGAVVAEDHEESRWPIVATDGPFCVADAGPYLVRFHARHGEGRVAAEIWKLP